MILKSRVGYVAIAARFVASAHVSFGARRLLFEVLVLAARSIVLLVVCACATLIGLGPLGCSTPDYRGDTVRTAIDPKCGGGGQSKVKPSILNGYADSTCDESPAVVKVGWPDGCTGTLVTPRVVLTAAHCVATASADGQRCTEMPPVWLKETMPGIQVTIERGGSGTSADSAPQSSATLDVKEVKRPDDDVVCGSDVALLILAQDVPAELATPMGMRLDRPIKVGEQVEVIGYGERTSGMSGRRDRTDPIGVDRVGPSDGVCGRPVLKPHEFETSRAFCHGDSGGPAILTATGEVVGVVSRNLDCSKDVGYVYTEIAGHRSFIERVLAETNAQANEKTVSSKKSAMSDMPLVFGSECASTEDCDTGICVTEEDRKAGGKRSYCTRKCDVTGYRPCPTNWTCAVEGTQQICVPKAASSLASDNEDDEEEEDTTKREVENPPRQAVAPIDNEGSSGCGAKPANAKSGSCEASMSVVALAMLLHRLRSRRRIKGGAATDHDVGDDGDAPRAPANR